MTAARSPISLTVLGSSETVEFDPERLVIAGFTGSRREQVQKHIDELAAEGVKPPDRTPAFYEVPVSLLTTDSAIEVAGDRTSGEVEPVLFCCARGWYVGVGSDHTDRELERDDIGASKAACPKPVSTEVVPYERAQEEWSRMTLGARAGSTVIQEGTTADIAPVPEIVAEFERRGGGVSEGLVIFLGTVALATPKFVFEKRYEMELGLGDGSIGLSYGVATAAAGSLESAAISVEGGSGSEA